MKNPFLCRLILFGQLFLKMILALKGRKLFDTTEAKKKNKKKKKNWLLYHLYQKGVKCKDNVITV